MKNPSARFAAIIGSMTLLAGSLGITQAIAAQSRAPKPAHAHITTPRQEFHFGSLGPNQLQNVLPNDEVRSEEKNYYTHLGEIDRGVAEAKLKNDPGSLRIVAWDDMTKLAGQIEDREQRAVAVDDIVSRMIKYDPEKAAYAEKDRKGTSYETWDQTTINVIGAGNGASGKGVCIDYANTLQATALRSGFAPRDVGIASIALEPIKQGEKILYHANDVINTGRKILVLEQNRVFTLSEFYAGKSPVFEGRRAVPEYLETLHATGMYSKGEVHANEPVTHYTPGPISDHDKKIREKINQRMQRLANDLIAVGVNHEPEQPATMAPALPPTSPRALPNKMSMANAPKGKF